MATEDPASGTPEPASREEPSRDVYATREEGEQYRQTVYRPVDYESLEAAPRNPQHPDPGRGGPYKRAELPRVPRLVWIIGPSAIMLGASLGSGETMFWPSLTAQFGWGLYWAFWVGVMTQFVMNTEIQRWTLATGESVFRGLERMHALWPWFFLAAGFVQLGWPGWAAGASKVFAHGVGLGTSNWVPMGIVFMLVIWLSYQAGPVLYNVIEKAQLAMMATAIVCALVIVWTAGSLSQLLNVPWGAVNFGALPPPEAMDIAVFLGGLAYAGAGGFVNLSQGVWSREKGFGMGTYQGRIKNPLRGNAPEHVHENGFSFAPTPTNMRRWKAWWRVTQLEHLLTFVVGLFVVATVAMTVSAHFAPGTDQGAIDMWLVQVIPRLDGFNAVLLYTVLFLALFSTQYAIVESFVRNSVDILYEMYGRAAGWDLSRTFLWALTIFVVWGILIIGARFQQPWILLVLGAAIAGLMMWPYNALVTIMNTTRLPEHLQPGWPRVVVMWWATGFFGYFSTLLVGNVLVDRIGLASFRTTVDVLGSGAGGYVLWVLAAGVQLYTMIHSSVGKIRARGTVPGVEDARGWFF